jgi:hypothetical protein
MYEWELYNDELKKIGDQGPQDSGDFDQDRGLLIGVVNIRLLPAVCKFPA